MVVLGIVNAASILSSTFSDTITASAVPPAPACSEWDMKCVKESSWFSPSGRDLPSVRWGRGGGGGVSVHTCVWIGRRCYALVGM